MCDTAPGPAVANSQQIDLVGSPFSVLESSPGVFTSLTRKLGARNLEFVELYDIEPSAVDNLSPLGLIFCFLWRKENHAQADFEDTAADKIWFANQLSDDACATQAILNVLLNCPDVDIGDRLREFRSETELMSPVIRGLAISNKAFIRDAHNSLARPADIRASVHAIATQTLKKEDMKMKASKAKDGKATSRLRGKGSPQKKKDESTDQETYHFIGYIPAEGKVWEMDGLKSGPLEVGELSSNLSSSGWMDIVRPALRMKMRKYGGGADGGDIRFSLLAMVEDGFAKASDEFEYLRRDTAALERRLGSGWEAKINPNVLSKYKELFSAPKRSPQNAGFSHRRLLRDAEIQHFSEGQLVAAWEKTVSDAVLAKASLDEELAKSLSFQADHTKRVHDYEPFFRELLASLHREGILNPLLNRDENGRTMTTKRRKPATLAPRPDVA